MATASWRLVAAALVLSLLAAALPASAAPPARRTAPDMTDPLTCLAIAIYWEARGESREGKRAVGEVVLNRVRAPTFPNDVCGVVTEGGEHPPCQFSFWCDGRSDRPQDGGPWRDARAIAHDLLDGRGLDPTLGALYFHNASVIPEWAHRLKLTARIGEHWFYR